MMTLPSRLPAPPLRLATRAVALACFGALAGLTASPLRAQSAAAQSAATAPLFAEDFESGALQKSVWEERTANGAQIQVQQAQVGHGKYALQIHYPKGGGRSYGFIVASHLPEALRTHCFGRVYVYVSAGMPAGHDVLLNAGTAGYPTSNFLEVGVSGGKNVMISYQQNGANVPRGETIARGAAYPVGRWFCLEWEFNDHPDHTQVWIDGQPAAESSFAFRPRVAPAAAAAAGTAAPTEAAAPATPAVTTDLVKGFVDFAFGFRAWGNGGKEDFDLYYDDIAIDTKRIGPK
jgi:hypothetical protein